ncbi:hypothetical protein FACS1894167_13580 [Synergistales bacterium]|nr:hypothetical protein FACS1894167_13580 [Synergistales bacterium]
MKNGETQSVQSIDKYAFLNCEKLTIYVSDSQSYALRYAKENNIATQESFGRGSTIDCIIEEGAVNMPAQDALDGTIRILNYVHNIITFRLRGHVNKVIMSMKSLKTNIMQGITSNMDSGTRYYLLDSIRILHYLIKDHANDNNFGEGGKMGDAVFSFFGSLVRCMTMLWERSEPKPAASAKTTPVPGSSSDYLCDRG